MTHRKLRLESLERRQLLAVNIQPAGSEFPVNSTTADYQEQSAVAVENDGDFVVVWSSHHGDGGIYGKMFESDGSVAKDEFLISNLTDGTQVYPDVAIDPASGSFVVTWQHDSPPDGDTASESDIFARAFSADGSPVGDQAQVSPAEGDHFSPAVAFTDPGDYVIAWDSFTASAENNVLARHFTSTNATTGDSFEVSTGAHEFSPDIASPADGSFVVTWESTDADGSGIVAQRFDSASSPVGTPLAVNTTTAGDQTSPSVTAQPDGSFLVAWISGDDAMSQVFNDTGTLVGAELAVNGTASVRAYGPSTTSLGERGFMVAWTGDTLDVLGRAINSDGTAGGDVATLNTTTDGDQLSPHVAAVGDSVIATWTGQDADRDGILGQAFTLGDAIPTADAGGPYSGGEGSTIALDASASTTPGGTTITSYAWDFDNDGQYDDATGVNPSFVQTDDGDYLVKLLVANSDGLTATAQASVTVDNVAPTAYVGGPYTITEGGTLLLSAAASTDPGGDIVSYQWDRDSDGTFDDVGKAITFSSGQPGTFDVTLRVTDDDGASDDVAIQIKVTKAAPIDLGTITFNQVTGAYPATSNIWYQVETSQAGFLTIKATASSGTATVALYDTSRTEPPLATGSGVNPTQRLDHQVGAGETYLIKLSGTSNDVDVTLANLVQHSGTEVTVSGTNQDDTFEFTVADSYLVIIKGVEYSFDKAECESIIFDGGAGDDTATLTGGPSAEIARFWPDHGTFGENGYLVSVNDVNAITAYAGGGADQAYLYDSPGDDEFLARKGYAKLSGEGFVLETFDFMTALGYATTPDGGTDTARFEDTAGPDKFKLDWPQQDKHAGKMYGGGQYYNRAKMFENIEATMTGRKDRVVLFGSDGDDTFHGQEDSSRVTGPGYDVTVTGYNSLIAWASKGNDLAYLEDSDGDDTVRARPRKAILWRGDYSESEYLITARGFDEYHLECTNGGIDKAKLHDTALADHVDATQNTAKLYQNSQGMDLLYEAIAFEWVRLYGTPNGGQISNQNTLNTDAPPNFDLIYDPAVWEELP